MLDTRLKKYSRNILIKIVAFLTIIICAFLFIQSFFNINDNVVYFKSIFYSDFYHSDEFSYLYDKIILNIKDLMLYYKDEQSIKNGKTLYDNLQLVKNGNPMTDEEAINYQLSRYKFYLNNLESIEGIYYYATNGGKIYTNTTLHTKDFFLTQPSCILITYNSVYMYPETSNIPGEALDMEYYADGQNNSINKDEYTIYIGLSESYIQPIINKWNSDKAFMINEIIKMVIYVLTSFIAFIYLLCVTGRKGNDDLVHLNLIDKIFTDINLILLIATFFCSFLVVKTFDNYYFTNIVKSSVCAFALMIILILFFSLIRHMKNKTFFKHSLIYCVFSFIFKLLLKVFNGGPILFKTYTIIVLFAIACAFGAFFFPLILVFIAIAFLVSYIYVEKFKKIKYGIEKVKEGDFSYKIDINGNSEFARMADNVNSITLGLQKAINNEVKSERMKSELITNVSHDIKTPLTSIINYVDLLKKEGTNSPNALKYLDILEHKSLRLKTLTEDLFVAAKASSGNMPVEFSKVDAYSLIQQGLGELDNKIENSKIEFKIGVLTEKLYVKADGKLLWRVIENLLSNVFKYALEGSRVYIDIVDLKDTEKTVAIIIKNISAYELNIPADELMERFKRGDESRSTEGSGLGLAIAKNLVEIQHGRLKIEIDGDLFKAIVELPKYEDETTIIN